MKRSLFLFPSVAITLALALNATAHAADCPVDLASARKLALVDDKGKAISVEAVDGSFVRRIEEFPPAPGATTGATAGPVKSIVDSFQGFFAETITTERPNSTFVQYLKLSKDNYQKLRAFAPLKIGSDVTLEYENVSITGGSFSLAAAPGPVSPTRQMRADYKVTGEEAVVVGGCTYRTVILVFDGVNGDKSYTSKTTYNFSPDLKTWLKMRGTYQNAGKPESVSERSIMSIGIAK
jgi:hypothetical protein